MLKKQYEIENKRMASRLVLIIMGCLIGIFLIYDHFYYRQIFKYSITFSIQLQKLNLYGISYFISHVFFYIIFSYIPLTFFLQNTTPKSLLNIMQFFFNIYSYTILKMIIRGSRPSFESLDLNSAKGFCENDYGNPSGHGMVSINILLIIARDTTQNLKGWRKFITYFICLSLSLVVCLSRLYFGVHSIDQTMLGLSFGFCVFLIFEVYEQVITENLVFPILYKDNFGYKKTRNLIIGITILFNVLIYIFWSICYYLETNRDDYFYFVKNCKMVFHKDPNFSYKLLSSGLAINNPIGIFLGMLNCKQNIKFATNFYYDRNIYKFIIRIVFFTLLYLPSLLSYYPRIPGKTFNILRANIILFLGGYVVSRYIFSLFEWFGIPYQKKQLKLSKYDLQ